MILDLHLHSELSDDSRAPVEAYLKLLQRKRAERPLDGIVLTEHRQFDLQRDLRELEDRYGLLTRDVRTSACAPTTRARGRSTG